jgi:hypothetical protein
MALKNIKIALLSSLLLANFLIYTPVLAASAPLPVYNPGVDSQIKQYLCAPPADGADVSGNSSLFTCINQLYKFAIVVAAVVGVFFIVIAGYLYMSSGGSDESVKTAKDMLTSTIASLVILMAGYILLKAINPDLIQFHPISPPGVTLPADAGLIPGGGGTGGGTGGGGSGGGTCQEAKDGVATSAALAQTCFGSNASKASMIANKETGGNSTLGSGTDICQDQNGNKIPYTGKYSSYAQSKGYLSVSWGLFQINISANPLVTADGKPLNCPSAFTNRFTGSQKKCAVTDMPLYEECIGAAVDANTNIANACKLSNNGQNWKPWANECGY